MPRVLRIINRFNLGGPTFNAAYLTKYLPDEYETLLVGGAKDDTEDSSEFILNELGIQPLIIPEMKRSVNLLDDRKAYKKIKEIIAGFKPDIVHTHASKAGALGRRAAYKMKVPVIVHTFHGHVFHSYFGKIKTGIYKNIERRLAQKSTAIIAISEKQKNELALEHRICSTDKINVIPLGFDLSRFHQNMDEKRKSFRQQYLVEEDEIVISIVGRLVPIKNHSFFIRVIKNLFDKNQGKKIRVFIVGDGEERMNIQEQLKTLQLDWTYWPHEERKAQVVLTSWRKDIDRVNAGSDIIALTSLNEGTPVSLIEAQAAGKAIVSTKTGGIEDIVIPGETALLTGIYDEIKFLEHLHALVNNAELRHKMALKGWEHVSGKFHYTALVNNVHQLYQKLLHSPT